MTILKRRLLCLATLTGLILSLGSCGSDSNDSSSSPQGNHLARVPGEVTSQVAPSALIDGDPLPKFEPGLPDPAIGMRAPDFTSSHYDDTEATVVMSDGKGKVLLFLAHWCPHCQNEVKNLQAWFPEGDIPENVDLVAISTAVAEGSPNYPPSDWFVQSDWPLPVVRDTAQGTINTAFGLSGFPYVVVVDPQGDVVVRHSGNAPTQTFEGFLMAAAG